MEALNFIRFWKPSNGGYRENRAPPCCRSKITTTAAEVPKALIASDHEVDEGDDSFFDLKLPLHGFDDKENVGSVNGEKRFESTEKQTRSVSPNDNFSKRKILPIESSSGPQSPIALIKSTPKFRVFTLRKSRSMANTSRTIIAERAELIGLPVEMESPKHEKQGSNNHFRVKFKTEDDSSKRLLKDLVQKYLNKFKPLYVKGSKKNSPSDKIKVSVDLPVPSPVSSPASVFSMKEKQTGVRGVCKQLGKSRSTSAASSSPISRRDDSLLLQHDGIQSAILHCKKSLNSSRESSRLSRCTSDSSQEKLSNASSTDSSLFSRVTSNSSYEKLMDSARTSSEDGNVV
ncbi:MEMBRANE-ASSOCIATED KINASE REGULATOR 5 [Hibiscus trionum]|uniref:MEMBRANE-ASSOCIATED KINASE REGULATOR 5 n=1 Tax=Hibiscus trionum TaxID=183268 RepID=A0A9W7HDE4_HIBTR|nr:MEMBRANE-ASSOCIATED KINASE REGULATOR 5 [Hibiscus trionum]